MDGTLSAAVINLTTNPVALAGLEDAVSRQVQIALGEPLGSVVGPQIGAAVAQLVSNPAVVPALLGVVDTLFADFFGTNGVVGAFSAAASEFALVLVTGGSRPEAEAAARQILKDSAAVATGVDASVTAAVAELLGDAQLWGAVDQTVSSLAVTLLGDVAVQQALHDRVAEAVELRITGDLGVFVGDQLGNLVVALVTNPVIQTGLLGVFDTLVSDFWTTPGVVTAFSEAAGALAYGALTGDPAATPEKVRADLQADPAVQAGVQRSVGAAVTELLSDSSLWSAVGGTLSAAVINLTSNPVVLDALGNAVSTQVQIALGEPLGSVVGPQIGAAVVQLVSNPAVVPALLGLVDTLFADFFGAPGVVDSFSTAASQLALVLLTGGSLAEAEKAARQILKASPAVDDGVDVAVTGAVAELLSDQPLWAAVDQTVSSLLVTLLGDVEVQTALGAAVAGLVEDKIPGELGQVVGAAVGDAVVSLVTNTDVQAGVYGVVDTLFVDFWTSPGVVTAFSEAAGALAKGALTGDPDAMKNVKEALQSNPDVDGAVDVSVTAAVSELLSDTALWAALNTTLSSLVGGLLTNPVVDNALYQAVDFIVEGSIDGPLGQVVGAQVATAVVALVTNSAVEVGLRNAVDTLFSDFFGAEGVIDAVAGAAGYVAKTVFTGDPFKDALATAKEELQANGYVDSAVQAAAGGAVTELLSDRALWAALDSTLSSLVAGLLGEPLVQQTISGLVASMVEDQVKGPAGAIVGARVGAAVVSLLTNPAIQTGVRSLVDTLATDFFGSPGVIDAFGVAAGDLALVAFVGGDLQAELPTVIQALRTDADVDAGVDFAVSAGVSQLLSDTALWAALDSTLVTLVSGLVNDSVVEQAIYQTISSNIEKALGGDLGAAVGPQVAIAVVSLLTSPALAVGLNDLVDTLFTDFFGAPGVIPVLSDAAGTLAGAAVFGNLAEVQPDVEEAVRTNPDIDGAVYGSVSAGVSQLLSDADLWRSLDTIFTTLVGGLLSEPAVQAALDTTISSTVSDLIGGDLGAVVGPQVATAVMSLVTDPAIGGALNTLTTALFYDFFSAGGVIPVLSDAAGTLAEAFVYGNLDEVGPAVEYTVRNNPNIDSAVDNSVTSGFTQFFSAPGVGQAVGSTVTTLVTNLLGDTVVQDAAGNAVAGLVTGYLGSSPIAGPVGQAVGVAVEQFLATAGVAADLGAILGGLIPDFLGQNGVDSGLGGALGTMAVELVRGASLSDAEKAALEVLKANPDVVAAVKVTIADALNEVDTTMLSDPTIQQSLGLITTDLIASLADNATVQTYVAKQYGAAVAGLLTNQAVVDEIADQLGLAVTELLAYPGVSTAITDSLDLFADEVIDGTKQTVALGDALTFLQTAPAFVAGVNAVIPNTVNTILADPAVLAAVEVLAQQEAIAAMQSFGIKIKFIDNIVGKIAAGTAGSFLTRPAGIGAIDGLAVNLVLGMPVSQVASYLGHEVVYEPKVRYALSFSIGQGIGSLFGDNIIGRLIGTVAGVPIAITLDITTGIERFYEWLSSGWATSPDYNPGAAASLPNSSHYFQPVPAATDLYVMNAVVLDRSNASAVRDAIAGDGRFTLTGLTVNDPDGNQPGSLDVMMAVEAAEQQDGDSPLALVAFRFPLDRLIPAAETAAAPLPDTVTAERVS
ncbi:MAG: hypothetical protein KIH64_013260 [Mycobacterium sp.]|nr:hypothetical protein [Mycobacterium sp.]